MADADGERNVERAGRQYGQEATRSALPHAVRGSSLARRGLLGSGPPPFIRRRLTSASPRLLGPRALASVAFWRTRSSRPVGSPHPIVAPWFLTRLDFYIQALFPRVSPALFGLRSKRGVGSWLLNFANRTEHGAAFACLRASSERGELMRTPAIRSLATVSLDESLAYLDAANGDELTAAFSLARDRNRLDGSSNDPDDAEIHHALFLLRKARGLEAPSFDLMRVQLRRRAAA